MNISMLKFFTLILTIFGCISYANATVISGNQTTADGKIVNLSGLEWLSFDHEGYSTLGVSRSAISASDSKWSVNGWRYASYGEVMALNDSLNLIRANNINNEDGIAFILNLWDSYTQPENTGIQSEFDRLYGAIGAYDANGTRTGFGWLQYISSYEIFRTNGDGSIVQTTTYSSYGRWTTSSIDPSRNPTYGSFLVRESQSIPEPSILVLFSIGLLGLMYARRMKVEINSKLFLLLKNLFCCFDQVNPPSKPALY